jgi:ACS family tartrate transporter-like MFS transporter
VGAASGIAAISAMGIIGGFAAPWFVGVMKDVTGDFRVGLGAIGCLAIVAAIALWRAGISQAAAPRLIGPAGISD